MSAVLFCLLVLIFSLHLICMNLAGSGLLMASLVEITSRSPDRQTALVATRLAGLSTMGILVGAALGALMLLFFWTPSYQDIFLRRLGTRPAFSLVQVAFSLVLHTIQWRWTASHSAASGAGRFWRAVLAVLSSTNLIYHFPTLFAIVAEIAPNSTSESAPIDRTQFYAFLGSGPILSHAAHFLLASLSTSGIAAAILVRKETILATVRRLGATIALVCTLLQIPVGIAVYLTLPGAAQRAMMGENLLLSLAFLASLGCALWLVQALTHLLPKDAPPSKTLWAGAALVLTILLMSGVLWGGRLNRLRAETDSTSQPKILRMTAILSCF